MRRLAPTLAVLATIASVLPADCAKALPFSSRPQVPKALDDVACRPPPWFRGLGLQTSAPFVCADYWWWITILRWGRAIETITELGDRVRGDGAGEKG